MGLESPENVISESTKKPNKVMAEVVRKREEEKMSEKETEQEQILD